LLGPSNSTAPPLFPPLTRECVWMPVLHRLGAGQLSLLTAKQQGNDL
jgi:hypothetical protein